MCRMPILVIGCVYVKGTLGVQGVGVEGYKKYPGTFHSVYIYILDLNVQF
jgi:hypothetical protein